MTVNGSAIPYYGLDDEFGNQTTATPGSRFAWLGGKSRRTELSSGIIQMGLRSYEATIGRFLSTDPVSRGSVNTHDYANQDPINTFDLTGESAACSVSDPRLTAKRRVSSSGHYTLKAKAYAHCSRSAKNVHAKAVIVGGAYFLLPGCRCEFSVRRDRRQIVHR